MKPIVPSATNNTLWKQYWDQLDESVLIDKSMICLYSIFLFFSLVMPPVPTHVALGSFIAGIFYYLLLVGLTFGAWEVTMLRLGKSYQSRITEKFRPNRTPFLYVLFFLLLFAPVAVHDLFHSGMWLSCLSGILGFALLFVYDYRKLRTLRKEMESWGLLEPAELHALITGQTSPVLSQITESEAMIDRIRANESVGSDLS